MIADRSLAIHIGLIKTGTTALQSTVFPRCAGLTYFGKPGKALAQPIRAISTLGEARWASAQPVVAEAFRQALADAGPCVLISEEEFSVGGEINSQADRAMIARRLRALFPHATIVVVVRNQLTALQSLYAYVMERSDRYRRFGDWLDHHHATTAPGRGLDVFDYAALVSLYVELFSARQVKVLLYEDMTQHYPQFIAELASALGLAPGALADIPIERRNGRPSLRRMRLTQWARRHPGVFGALDRAPRSLLRAMERYVNAGPPIDTRYSADHRALVSARYAASNAWLSDFLGTDLRSLEYPCL